MRFAVVIPTLGRPAVLADTLAGLARCTPPPDEVVVVDGDPAASARATTEGAAAAGGAIRYLIAPASATGQRNRGMADAEGDVLVFLDDDVLVDPAAFAVLARAYEDPAVIGATGRVIEPASHRYGGRTSRARRWLFGGGREGTFTRFGYPRYLVHADRPRDVEFMPGCFMSARRSDALAVGFDEHLEGYALAEDEDFSYRLSRRGRIRYLPDAVVHHRKLGFGSQDPRAFGRRVVVNRAYLFRKNFPQTALARAQFGLLVAVQIGHRLLNGDWAGARGLVDGAAAAWRERRSPR
ncbi:MAG TPA: glycosyltransferase [Actinomycetota bacterium]|nr:glycosyltransferase [Actinomycetota bacterium]